MNPSVAPPLALYLHFPWCVRKCPYCDFNSHEAGTSLPEAAYVDKLLEDLSRDRERWQIDPSRELVSLFLGGGTPSLFGGQEVRRLFEGIRTQCQFAPDCEITLEANPGTSDAGNFPHYREAGVNRLSLGIQSLSDPQLKRLGRIHDGEKALKAFRLARQAGFDNLNCDLMHGLPNQTLSDALDDLKRVLELEPEHLSWYQLTIEPNTEYYRRPPSLPEEGLLGEIQDEGHALLEAAGYLQYEVSAYSRPGKESRHNINYWQFGDYLGIGAGAHGKVTFPSGEAIRYWKTRHPNHYLQRIENLIGGQQAIAESELPFEFMMNALRLRNGTSLSLFCERTGLTPESLEPARGELQQKGLLSLSADRLACTETGFRFLNEVLAAFLPDDKSDQALKQ